MLAGHLIFPPVAMASDPPPEVPRAALLDIARQFVSKVNTGFGVADQYLIDLDPDAKRKAKYKVDIPDGEMLLLRVGLNKSTDRSKRFNLMFEEPVIAIKQGDDVMVSLSDFFNVAQFAIEVKPAEGVAEGWFIRKAQTFRMDAKTMTATVRGEEFKLSPGDITVEETDILVKGRVLEHLFDFESEVILATQLMAVRTDQKWPSLEKLERLRRKGRQYLPPPELPRQEEAYDIASVPNINVTTSRSFSRSPDGRTARSSDYKLDATGDMLKHSARILAAGSPDKDKVKLEMLKATFKRESDKPDLLGWMRAHKYEFGDLGGGIGFTATNRNPYFTSDPTTTIEGDMPPGWDAELYRGPEYISSISNSEGRYLFEDVPLTIGFNAFKIMKYGPLGEIEEEEITIYSALREKGFESGLYNVSVAAAATDLWAREPKDTQDKYTPIINGDYQWQANDITSLKAGIATSQSQGEQKTFPKFGVASYLDGTFLNTSTTFDVDGAFSSNATARRRLFEQNISLGAGYTSQDFGSISGAEIPSYYSLNASMRGRLPGASVTYGVGTSYSEDEEDNASIKNTLSLSGRVLGLGVSTGLDQSIKKSPEKESEALNGFTALSGNFRRTNWRASADYSIVPDGWTMNSYNLNLTRGLARNVAGNLGIQNNPGEDTTSGTASVIWSGKYARVAPTLKYDSENNLAFILNSSFGLAYNSHGNNLLNDFIMRGKELTRFGGVSAFVYLDKNGDNVFSEGDEPIQDAIVEAVHSRVSATTNEKGEAFIFDLPSSIVTDIRLNEFSFFDPYLVPGFAGVSVLPRAGHDVRIEFPVHNGGEMDGSVFVQTEQGKPRSLRNIHLYLHDMDGRLVRSAVSSFDGFYLFQKIPPGKYYLVVDEKDAKNFGLIRTLPEIVSFGYEGTIVYGHNIVLDKAAKDGAGDVPLNVGADYSDFISMNPTLNPDLLEGKAIVLNLGSYHSNLLTALTWYKIMTRYHMIIGNATLLVEPKDSYASAETGLHTLRVRIPGYDMGDAWQRCRALMARGLYCGVEVMPNGERKEAANGTQSRI